MQKIIDILSEEEKRKERILHILKEIQKKLEELAQEIGMTVK
jgi:hypothetical protein